MTVDAEVLGWLRGAVESADSWESVGAALRSRDQEGDDVRLRPFIFAYGYAFHERSTSARERAGGPYGAMLAGEGWRFPPALEEIEDDDVRAWYTALTAVDHPVVHARLGDLLWERKAQPDPHVAAGLACDGLLAVATDDRWRGMDRVRCLSRGLEIARETRDTTRQDKVVSALLAFADDDLRSDKGGPGISLGVLTPLVELPLADRPEVLDVLLQRVAAKYGADPYIVDAVVDLRTQLLDDAGRHKLRKEQVQRWKDESAVGDGMLRVHRLEQALEIARNYGLKDEAEELRRELGRISPEELGLKSVSAELAIPREEVDRFLQSFNDAPSWQQALGILAAQQPPGGSPEELAEYVDQLMEAHPLQFLFTKALIGPDNATALFRAATPEQHRRLALSEQRAWHARFWGAFCADALVRIGGRRDRPDRPALTAFLTHDSIDDETAERIARAIELFWDAQPDESAHILVPRLERVLREMARQVGIPVVREPRPDRDIGGVEMLGALLRDLEGAFADRAMHAYLFNLLADPLGLNLRNTIAHGLGGVVGAVDAALLIQAALWLASMSVAPVENPPTAPPGAAAD